MSARHFRPDPIAKCGCGRAPGIHKDIAGDETIYFIACDSGAATEKSEDFNGVIGDWNDQVQRAGASGSVS